MKQQYFTDKHLPSTLIIGRHLFLPAEFSMAAVTVQAQGPLVFRNKADFGVKLTWVQIPAPPIASCGVLGKLLNLSEPQLLHLLKEGKDTDKSSAVGWMGGYRTRWIAKIKWERVDEQSTMKRS